jgi:hypothetical protein
MPYTEKADPNLENLRTDKELPSVNMSRIEMELAAVQKP